MSGTVTLTQIQAAYEVVKASNICYRTPLVGGAERYFRDVLDDRPGVRLYMKLENMQTTGSFKVRGLSNQLANLSDDVVSGRRQLVTMSAGNYGKAFAFALNRRSLKGRVLMPLSAPASRRAVIGGYGIDVETMTSAEIMPKVREYVREKGMQFLHSFDDLQLIAGHASLGLEVLEDVPDVDVVVVCCGGGGLVSGVAAAIKLSGKSCRVYGVEPVGACTMSESFKEGKPVSMPTVKSVAAGLAPPFAGEITYQHCRQFVDDILLVSDSEIVDTMSRLFDIGLVVEPSGCAALAALLFGRVPDCDRDKKIVAVLTGGNVTTEELYMLTRK